MKRLFILLLFVGMLYQGIYSQHVGIKSNLLYDATTTLNLGVEYRLSSRWSLDFSGNYNPWSFSANKKWKHWLIQPELRYWKNEVFRGNFFAVHALGTQFNVSNVHLPFGIYEGLQSNRYQGWAVGAGLGYGYAWNLNCNWNIEAEVGVGYVYADYKRYLCTKCGQQTGAGAKHYLGPTKLAVNLVYVIGGRERCSSKKSREAEMLYDQQLDKEAEERDRKKAEEQEKSRLMTEPTLPNEVAIDKSVKSITENKNGEFRIHFIVGRTLVLKDFEDNATELNKLKQLLDELTKNSKVTITRIRLDGYSSIEGTVILNKQLAQDRVEKVREYIRQNELAQLSNCIITAHGEDWEGLVSLIKQDTNMAHASKVLRIIEQTDIMKGREKQLMELAAGVPYRYMAEHMFPQLRRVECLIEYQIEK
ncbi:MAG: DUF3575 domain-containing protein [Bacteroides sp.]